LPGYDRETRSLTLVLRRLDPAGRIGASYSLPSTEKDRVFLDEAARMGFADERTLLARLGETALDDARRETAGAAIAAAFRSARPPA
jgi:hypothetical protein